MITKIIQKCAKCGRFILNDKSVIIDRNTNLVYHFICYQDYIRMLEAKKI